MELFQGTKMTYNFKYNIEQVYRCFVSYNIISFLKKKGLLNWFNIYLENCDLSSNKEILFDKPGISIVHSFDTGEIRSIVEDVKNTPSFKQFKLSLQTLNRKVLVFVFRFVFKFYQITEDNSTVVSFNIESSIEEKDRTSKYLNLFSDSNVITIFKDIEEFLQKWYRPEIIMESTLINVNIQDLFNTLINGSIFLRHPVFKGFNLVVERKPGYIGSSYSFMKKGLKYVYTINHLSKESNCINLIFDKKASGSQPNREYQMIIVKLDENLSMLQYYTKMNFSLNGYQYSIFQEHHKKVVIGIKAALESEKELK